MKTLKKITFLLLTVLIVSCESKDNEDTGSRSANEIKVYLNGATTPDEYSTNIVAKEIPLPATTGYVNVFKISSVDRSNNPFELNFLPSINSPYAVTTPSTETLTGTISNRLKIGNITFDDTATNNLTITYNTFGTATGNPIDIDISGTYYETGNTTAQTLNVTIQVNRQ